MLGPGPAECALGQVPGLHMQVTLAKHRLLAPLEASKPGRPPARQLQRRLGGGSRKTYDFYLDSVPLKNQRRTPPHWPARNLKGKQ